MRALRYWSVRHAAGLEQLYGLFARIAPALAPAVRWLGASRSEIVLQPVERWAKGLMFDCRMCGQCALASTGMACPTNCAKRMRNGPCGGVRPDGSCEIDRAMRCVWIEAIEGRKRIAPPGRAPVLAPIDHSREGRSTWIRVIEGLTDAPQADAPAARERPIERFEQACRSPRFVVTVEIAPPDSADPSALLARAARFPGLVDAVNITDGAGGNCHMSSAAAAAVLAAHGHTPVCQIACRDRNRIAVQGDILGAAALGVRNFLCLTGDDVGQGDHPQAKPVFDLDAVALLRIARDMRDRGEFASGRKLDVAPDLFLGATANPFVPPYDDRVANLEQKIEAGADFIQTQFCFDLPLFERFMDAVRARGLHQRAPDHRRRRHAEQRQGAALDVAPCSRRAHPAGRHKPHGRRGGPDRRRARRPGGDDPRDPAGRGRRRRASDGTQQRGHCWRKPSFDRAFARARSRSVA